jgi:hypothetical protein
MIILGALAARLGERQQHLISHSDAAREALAYELAQWERPRRIIDKAFAMVMYVRAHPVLLAIGVAAVVAIQRRGAWGWVRRAVGLWRLLRTVRSFAFR